MKNTITGLLLTAVLIFLTACLSRETDRISETVPPIAASTVQSEDQTPEETVMKYFEESYDYFLNLQYPDLSDVLDMNVIQCQNKIEIFKEVIDDWKYSIEVRKDPYILEKLEYTIQFTEVSIKGNEADIYAKLDYKAESTCFETEDGIYAYPHFMTFGINHFHLNHNSGKWLIDSHDNDAYGYDFDASRTERYYYDKEKADQERRKQAENPKPDSLP